MNRRGRLLVVAPHATRTGSTQVLLDLFGPGGASPLPVAVALRSGGARAAAVRALGSPLASGEQPAALFVNSALAADAVAEHRGVPAAVYLHEGIEALAELDDACREGLLAARRVLCIIPALA